jgi:streptogramin lyase
MSFLSAESRPSCLFCLVGRIPALVAVTALAASASFVLAGGVASATAPAPGQLAVIAGNGTYGAASPGTAISSDLEAPSGVAVDSTGDVYFADESNNVVDKVTPGGTLSIIAGTGTAGAPATGTATASPLDSPSGVAVDSTGDVYIADTGNDVVEKVTSSGILSIVAGNGHYGPPTNGTATSSNLGDPYGVAVDGAGTCTSPILTTTTSRR